jgi:homoserine dehydrogenase
VAKPSTSLISADTIVLKFGGSILARTEDIARAVHECYRWYREGHRVLAVVSAIGDATDRLIEQAERYGHAPHPSALASLVATGESTSAAHLWLGCDAAGLSAVALDPREFALRVGGPADDATPHSVDADALRRALDDHGVVIIPGFVGIDERGRIALLGRGGSDLTAILLAASLGARCRLIKDVAGLYEHDPARPGPFARRYASITFDDAARLGGAILQPKALRFASERRFAFEVAALARADGTLVGAATTAFADEEAHQPSGSLRVAQLGLGVVGRGIWTHLMRDRARPGSLFEPVGVAVRQAKRHADLVHPRLLVTDAVALAERADAEIVIETIGGTDVAYEAAVATLCRGACFVTANKALLAECGTELEALAEASGGRLLCSAAVGGAAPLLEFVRRLRPRGILRLEGVLNGTTNHMLDAQRRGASFAEALAEAQALGFAETDPSADLDGIDAAQKLILLARAAFESDPDQLDVSGIRGLTITPGERTATRLVARAERIGERVVGSVRAVALDPGDPLADAHGEWNALVITTADGVRHRVRGKGAGRGPTAEAVLADLFAYARERMGAAAVARSGAGEEVFRG